MKSAQEFQHSQFYYKLGEMYEGGLGVAKDYKQAAFWYTRASYGGLFQSYPYPPEKKLANLYDYGVPGLEKDYEQAIIWYNKKTVYDPSKYSLIRTAELYAFGGHGIKKDYYQAIVYYTKYIDEIKHMTPTQKTIIGYLYQEGEYGIKQDFDEALFWYRKAADEGYFDSELNLAQLYHSGFIVEKNYQQALLWYIKAAENKHVSYERYRDVQKVQITIGDIYKRGGYGIDKNYTEALSWYTKVTSRYSSSVAQNKIGHM